MGYSVIGLDIGHSAVKVVGVSGGRRKTAVFPSQVSGAFHISDEQERRVAEMDTVSVGGVKYFTGETARIQGGSNVVVGLSDDWIESPQHEALLLSALGKMRREGVSLEDGGILVLGLPSSLYDRQKDTLRKLAERHVKADIKVLRQPMGGYYTAMLNEHGAIQEGRSMKDDSFGVVDIGYYTTDFMLVIGGHHVERGVDSSDGMRMAAQALQRELVSIGNHIDLPECEEVLRTRKLIDYGKVIDASPYVVNSAKFMVDAIVDKATQVLGADARRLNGVIVTGGGAEFVYDELKRVWPHVTKSPDHRMAIADGYARFGLAYHKAKQAAAAPSVA